MALWTPEHLPGVLLWLDAGAPGTFTVDGSNGVVSWASRVGNIVVSSPAGLRPVRQETGRNGLPCVRFAPDQHLFSDAIAALPVGDAPCTMACVAWLDSGGPAYPGLMSYGKSADYQERTLFSNGGSRSVGFSTYASDISFYVPWSIDRIVVAQVVADHDLRQSIDGRLYASDARFATAAGGRLSIGKHSTGGDYWKGIAQELLIVGRTLTDDERLRLEGYLAHRWGRQANLQDSHPYRFVPPQIGAPLLVRHDGAWRTAKRAYVNRGGVWTPAAAVAVRDGGWKDVDLG